jgi:hypothetical protein
MWTVWPRDNEALPEERADVARGLKYAQMAWFRD